MKKLTYIVFCLTAALTINAAPLSPEQALQRLSNGNRIVSAVNLNKTPVYTAHNIKGIASAYVFNNADGKGFKILSADDAAYPVLGYSETGSFDPAHISPEFSWWMEYLGAQIETGSRIGVESNGMVPAYANMERIEALVQTKWNQDAPYYNQAPTLNGKRCYTGCVATSMAQVVNYHKYPSKGIGTVSYNWSAGGNKLTLNLEEQNIDWANMLNVYQRNAYTEQQGEAVAYLMKCCGYSVEMNYNTDGSGAQGSTVAYALKKYFGYDGNVSVKYRMAYSSSQWAQMIYDNLKNVGPLVMNGRSYESNMGHSFVCDGYDGNGYFHFNWGWGGMSDGWYLLESLNPDAQGIGGSMGGGFNYNLNAIFGIQPPTGNPVETVYANMLQSGGITAQINNKREIAFTQTPYYPQGWYNAMGYDIMVNLGVIVEPIDGTSGNKYDINGQLGGSVLNMRSGSYFPGKEGPKATLPELADGRYKVTIGVKDLKVDDIKSQPHYPIIAPYGIANYVYVTVKDGNMTVEDIPVPTLQVKGLTAASELYYGSMGKFIAKLLNNTDFELTETICPALLENGKIAMVGDMAPTAVEANTEGEVEWIATIRNAQGYSAPKEDKEYTLAIINPVTNVILGQYGNVVLHPQSLKPLLNTISADIVGVEGVTEETETGRRLVYNITDAVDFTAEFKFQVQQGFFDGVVEIGVYAPNPENISELEPIYPGLYMEQPFLNEGEQSEISVPVNMGSFDGSRLYVILFSYTSSGQKRNLTRIYFRVPMAGLSAVGEETLPVSYYNLQGVEIKEPERGQVVIKRSGIKTEKILFQ